MRVGPLRGFQLLVCFSLWLIDMFIFCFVAGDDNRLGVRGNVPVLETNINISWVGRISWVFQGLL